MDDTLTTGLAGLDALDAPLAWTDVERRAIEPHLIEVPGIEGVDDRPRPNHRRTLAVAAAILVLVAGAVAVTQMEDDDSTPIRTGKPTTTTTGSTTTLLVDANTDMEGAWQNAVVAWTGKKYLVWSGSRNDTEGPRADGWRYAPLSGGVERIPDAPIGARVDAGGVWTGEELIVCCGTAYGSEGAAHASGAAAYDPDANEWRTLQSPPDDALGTVVGTAWTGDEMLVLLYQGDPNAADRDQEMALWAFDPDADQWSERARPPFGDRLSQTAWGDGQLALWSDDGGMVSGEGGLMLPSDRGALYDPEQDEWTPLPALPRDAPTSNGSVAWLGDQLVVVGLDATDRTRATGFRIRPGQIDWQPIAPLPIEPIQPYEGTSGSQSLAPDEASGRIVVYPPHGYEHSDGTDGLPRPDLLAYDPVKDQWTKLGSFPTDWYAPELLVVGGEILTPTWGLPIIDPSPTVYPGGHEQDGTKPSGD